MEDSFHSSSLSKSTATDSMKGTEAETPEESGWTSYFEDFLATQQRNHQNHHQDDHHQNSFADHRNRHDHPVPDAASYVECNSLNSSMNGGSPKFFKKLNFIKKTGRRTREIHYDDSLEDTASSPVNSPKVGSLKEMDFNQTKTDDIIGSVLGKVGGCDDNLQLQKRDDQTREMVFEEKKNDSTDLRKRGLCLVPLSVFVNYL